MSMPQNNAMAEALRLRAKQRAEEQAAANARAAVTDQSRPLMDFDIAGQTAKTVGGYIDEAAQFGGDQLTRAAKGMGRLMGDPNEDNPIKAMRSIGSGIKTLPDLANAMGDTVYGVKNAMIAPIDPLIQSMVRGTAERLTAGQPEGAAAPGMGVLSALDDAGTFINKHTGISKQNLLDLLTWEGGHLAASGAKAIAPTVKQATKIAATKVAEAGAPIARRLAESIVGKKPGGANVEALPNAGPLAPDTASKDWFSNAQSRIDGVEPPPPPPAAPGAELDPRKHIVGKKQMQVGPGADEAIAASNSFDGAQARAKPGLRAVPDNPDAMPAPVNEPTQAPIDLSAKLREELPIWRSYYRDRTPGGVQPGTWARMSPEQRDNFLVGVIQKELEGQRPAAPLSPIESFDGNTPERMALPSPKGWPKDGHPNRGEVYNIDPSLPNDVKTRVSEIMKTPGEYKLPDDATLKYQAKFKDKFDDKTPSGKARPLGEELRDPRYYDDEYPALEQHWAQQKKAATPDTRSPIDMFDGNDAVVQERTPGVTYEAGVNPNIGKDGRTKPGTTTQWKNPTESGERTSVPETTIVTNPSLKQAKQVADQSDWGEVRYLIDPDTGDVHLWPSDHGYHDDAAMFMGRPSSEGMFHGSFGVNNLKEAMQKGSKTFEEAVYDMRRHQPDTIGSPENGWAQENKFSHGVWDQARMNSDARHGGPIQLAGKNESDALVGAMNAANKDFSASGKSLDDLYEELGAALEKPKAAAPVEGGASPAKMWADALAARKAKQPYTRVGAQRGEVQARGSKTRSIDDLKNDMLVRTSDEPVNAPIKREPRILKDLTQPDAEPFAAPASSKPTRTTSTQSVIINKEWGEPIPKNRWTQADVVINPSASDLKRMVREMVKDGKYKEIRAVRNPKTGDVAFWPADDGFHADVADALDYQIGKPSDRAYQDHSFRMEQAEIARVAKLPAGATTDDIMREIMPYPNAHSNADSFGDEFISKSRDPQQSPLENFDGNTPEAQATPEQKLSRERTGEILAYKEVQPEATAPMRAEGIRQQQFSDWLDPNRPLIPAQKVPKTSPKELTDLNQKRADGTKGRVKYEAALEDAKAKVGDDFVKERKAAFPQTADEIVTTTSLAAKTNKALEAHIAMTPEQRFVNYDAAVESLRDIWPSSKGGGVFNFLSANKKLLKNSEGYMGREPVTLPNGQGVESTGLTLSPAKNHKGFKTCVKFGACEKSCLGLTSGGNRRYAAVRILQGKRTTAVLDRPEAAAINIFEEIVAARNKAKRNGNVLTIRMNVLSDVHPKVWKPLIEHFDDVIFIDYTKSRNLPVAHNHHLTYSSSGVSNDMVSSLNADWALMSRHLDEGDNVAMAFSTKKSWPKWVYDEARQKVRRVVDGVSSDFRIIDAQQPGREGVIVGLKNMDETSKSADYNRNVQPHEDASVTSEGFMVHYDPTQTTYKGGKEIRDPQGNVIPPGDIAYIGAQTSAKTTREAAKRVQINKIDADGNVSTTYAREPNVSRGIGDPADKSTWRTPEGEERAALVAERKAIHEKMRPLAMKAGGGLTGAEAKEFTSLAGELASMKWRLAAPANAKTVKPNPMLGDLKPETVAGAHNALIALPEETYKAVDAATMGVKIGAETEVDDIMRGRVRSTSPQEFYDAFQPTRDALREQYGDKITLYRATSKQVQKPTANWAITKEFAQQFGPKTVKREIPIDDVIALNTSRDGNYHEFIVGSPPKENLSRMAIARDNGNKYGPAEMRPAVQTFTVDPPSPRSKEGMEEFQRNAGYQSYGKTSRMMEEGGYSTAEAQRIRSRYPVEEPKRPFKADYPNKTDASGKELKRGERLTTTIDGDPIPAGNVVWGRQKAGGKDVSGTKAETERLARALMENVNPRAKLRYSNEGDPGGGHMGGWWHTHKKEPDGSHVQYSRGDGSLINQGDYVPRDMFISKLNKDGTPRSKAEQDLTLGHETGHLVDFLTQDASTRDFTMKRPVKDATDITSRHIGTDLPDSALGTNTPKDIVEFVSRADIPPDVGRQLLQIFMRSRSWKGREGSSIPETNTPVTMGYKPHRSQAELMAEAVNLYRSNPGLIKEQFPEAAEWLRKLVNRHPATKDRLTLNELGGMAGGSGLAAWLASQGGNSDNIKKEY